MTPSATVALLRDFVNTLDREEGSDQLADPDATGRWCTARGLLAPDDRLTAAEHRRVLELREGLRRALQLHAGSGAAADVDVDAGDGEQAALDLALATVPIRVRFDGAGRLRLAGNGGAAAVGALLDAVLRCQVDGDWERLKVCAEDSCRWAYFDASRNRSGRWCSMSECGNRVKMRRAYATRRRRERAEPAG
jgi:predicted RNA-binding Zn ribbon-like protein